MSIKIICPHCQQHLESDEKWQGMEFDCPTCNRPFKVPKLNQQVIVKKSLSTRVKSDNNSKSQERKLDEGLFSSEKKAIDNGVARGLTMMFIAVVWFVAGCAVNIIFFYPPILFLIGVFAFIKGLANGNFNGQKKSKV